MSDGVTPVPQ